MVISKASYMDRDLGEGLQVRACRGDSLLVTATLNSRSHPSIAGAEGGPGALWALLGSGIVCGWSSS